MTRSRTSKGLDFDLEIEKTLRHIRRSKKNRKEEEEDIVMDMENQHINMNNQIAL